MPESVYSTSDLDHDYDRRPRPRPSPRRDDDERVGRRDGRLRDRPHRQPKPRRQSPSCSSCSSCCSACSNDANRGKGKSRNSDALVPHPSLGRPRRGSVASSDGSAPEEYTVLPDGRIHEHRRRGEKEKDRYRRQEERYRDWDGGRGGGRDRDRDRRRRSKDEAKGLLIAAVVFVASLVLCWD